MNCICNLDIFIPSKKSVTISSDQIFLEEDFRLIINQMITEVMRYLNLDSIIPSVDHLVTACCLRALCHLEKLVDKIENLSKI